MELQSVEKELESSEAVFSGKIIDITTEKNNRKILFEVEETWKGVSQTEIILKDEWSSCSLNFSKGESYLVYADDFQGEMTSDICNRTKALSGAGEDLATLGKGTTPTEEVDLKNQLRNPVVRYIYIWLPLVSLLIVAAVFIRKRSGY
ncbi:cbiN domain protein [Mesobacillus selenatarsenatis SF-1]|uniref:CbiN domain protein n=1 Tax=Mesobacillus selenatarsenatis (strain DSM 18680 / JCM 14380 / FERM P-15431 / SF-1) TaxID=1321606 RepID=A0A0A8WZQ0_MESS1|nr:cbiN domain protein [Mesobacillus selenatarsenatis SF-1]